MKQVFVGMVLTVGATMASAPAFADSHKRNERVGHRAAANGMQVVVNGTTTGQAGYGWRYFTDAHNGRGVVISPDGAYYYSDGRGLELVFKGNAAPTAG